VDVGHRPGEKKPPGVGLAVGIGFGMFQQRRSIPSARGRKKPKKNQWGARMDMTALYSIPGVWRKGAQGGARVHNLPRASDRLVDITPGGQDKQKQSGGRGGPAR